MKGSEFFKKVNDPLGVQIPEDVLAKLAEIEVPDDLQSKFSEVYISKERAKHEPEIIEHVAKETRKDVFRIVDEKIKTLYPFVGQDHQNVLSNTFETYKKLDILKAALDEAKKNDSKGKVSSEDIQKVENEWAEKLKAEKAAHQKEIETLHVKNKEAQFEWIVSSKLGGYTLADQFSPLKDNLAQLALIDLKKKNYLYEVENGTVFVRKEENGIKRDAFEDGTENKLTLERLLDKFVDPFVKKNNAETNNKPTDPTSSGTRQNTEPPAAGDTFRDRMWKQTATA